MKQQLHTAFRQLHQKRLSSWLGLVLPGLFIIGLVCLLRLSGLMQGQEWMLLDTFSRNCSLQPASDRIALVSIEEADYQALGEFPISDENLAKVLVALKQYQPRVIGLDLMRNLSTEQAYQSLYQLIDSMPNVVIAEPAVNLMADASNAMSQVIAPQQIGFSDAIVDADGKIRRAALAMPASTTAAQATQKDSKAKYSMAVQLVRRYLASDDPIQLINTSSLPQFHPNSGGYVRAEVSEHQVLMNFCMLQRPYETVSLRDLLAENVDAESLRDRIVIVGNTATGLEDSFITSAVRNTLYSTRISGPATTTKLIYSIEIHAHAAKQILSSVLGAICVLRTWGDPIEYLWIVGWGIVGISISLALMSPWKSVLSLGVAIAAVLSLGYLSLNNNLWIPVVPTILSVSGAGLVTAFLDRDMRFELAQQKIAVERTYEAFHNGPLQKLATILRNLRRDSMLPIEQQQQLQNLNIEMRTIFERMRQDIQASSDRLYLIDGSTLDIQHPLSDLLYQVYESTLDQNLPGFANVQTYIFPNFEPLNRSRFSTQQKRGLCLFLQEGLINVGKYAIGATRVDVIYSQSRKQHKLQVIDNGSGLTTPVAGQGTHQAMQLARMLKGTFRRIPNADSGGGGTHLSQGVLCEIVWAK